MTTNLYATCPLDDPANQIRLLQFEQANGGGNEVICSISAWPLDSLPDFNAASYTWGDAAEISTIKVAGEMITVRTNCLNTLLQIQKHSPADYLWIDSICINQTDNAEKSHQVAMMGDIYARASRVLACIGRHDRHSELVAQGLKDIKSTTLGRPEHTSKEARYEAWKTTILTKQELWARALDAAYDEVAGRPYFRRAWIMQELYEGAENVTVLCGDSTMDWPMLLALNDLLYDYFDILDLEEPELGRHVQPALRFVVPEMMNTFEERLFPSFLGQARDLRCFDARDRIFGTLRLVNWQRSGVEPIVPDYSITAYDLAVQAVSKATARDFEDVIFVTDALELRCVDEGVQAFVARRSAKHDPTSHAELQRWHGAQLAGVSRLSRDRQNRLIARLRKAGDPGKHVLKDSRPVAPDEFCSYTHVPIYAGSEIAAFTTGNPQPGDIMIDTRFNGFIVRETQEQHVFKLVGCVAFIADYTLWINPEKPDVTCQCYREYGTLKTWSIRFTFELSDEEAIVVATHTKPNQPNAGTALGGRLALNLPRTGSKIVDVSCEGARPLLTHFLDEHFAKVESKT